MSSNGDFGTTDLVVVLICKNQGWNIARLIESTLKETARFSSREIILVDSASTDDTVAVACHYDITVIRLDPEQRLTAAAGRHVGYQHSSGEFILFLDGDMELCEGWLETALITMRKRPDVAVVSGQLIDLPKATKTKDGLRLQPLGISKSFTEVPHGGGAAMYRRSVFQEIGAFNPYLYSDEEPELCIRVRYAGYRVIRLERPIAHHYSDPTGTFATLLGRWRRNLYLGAGQNLRYHLGSKMFWPYYNERGFGVVPALGLLGGLLAFFWALGTGRWLWFGVWLWLVFGIIAVDVYRRRSLYRTAASLLERLLIVDGTVRGFLPRPLEPKDYLLKLEIVQTARNYFEVVGSIATSKPRLEQRSSTIGLGSIPNRPRGSS